MVATILLCVGIGAGIGALVGFPALIAVGGFFVGVVAGIALVYSRFKHL